MPQLRRALACVTCAGWVNGHVAVFRTGLHRLQFNKAAMVDMVSALKTTRAMLRTSGGVLPVVGAAGGGGLYHQASPGPVDELLARLCNSPGLELLHGMVASIRSAVHTAGGHMAERGAVRCNFYLEGSHLPQHGHGTEGDALNVARPHPKGTEWFAIEAHTRFGQEGTLLRLALDSDVVDIEVGKGGCARRAGAHMCMHACMQLHI